MIKTAIPYEPTVCRDNAKFIWPGHKPSHWPCWQSEEWLNEIKKTHQQTDGKAKKKAAAPGETR